jgi:AraC-like DNA-binding protein
MLFLKRTPSASISAFVEYLWLLSDAPPHSRERILPTGTLELVINLNEDEIRIHDPAGVGRVLSGTVFSGAYAAPFEIDAAMHALIMGVHFRPGGASAFTRMAPGDLANAHIDAAAVWGSPAKQLRERLRCAMTPRERFDILDAALVARAGDGGLASALAISTALRRLAQPQASVREIVSSVGLSHRHFASVFRREVGMTPKLFARVQRFQRAIALAKAGSIADCARLSAECGYYDQAHMNRDFAEFARATPREYIRRRNTETKDHHVPLR